MPYAFINDRTQLYPHLKANLSLSPQGQAKFDALNLHIRNAVVFPGQLVIIGDSSVASCTVEEALLMGSAQSVKLALLANSATDSFVIDNYDQLQSIMARFGSGLKN